MDDLYGRAASPQEILDAREKRAARQQEMLSGDGSCVISFTLNIVGPVKLNPLMRKSFDEGNRYIRKQLQERRIIVLQQEERVERSGCEALYSVDLDAFKIKKLMVAIEECSPLGRLFDIDVITKEGGHLSRKMLGLESRRCLICERPAHECGRSRRHDSVLLRQETERIMQEHFQMKHADYVAATACRSMLYEVCVTPKPGLVDRKNSGSHRDMDIFTFMDSAAVLTPHFRRLYLLGSEHAAAAPVHLLERLRFAGMLAEEDMLNATNGVNTHKGLIFSLGILCAALGWSEVNAGPVDAASLLSLCGEIAKPALESDLQDVNTENAATAGERLYAVTGNTGVRGEAAAGFPSVLHCGLPVLRRMIAEGKSLNDAGVYTLLALMGKTTDTNTIARCGRTAQQEVQKAMQALFDKPALPSIEDVKEIDRQFIERNISAGGCADLLALTLMLYFLEEAHERQFMGEV